MKYTVETKLLKKTSHTQLKRVRHCLETAQAYQKCYKSCIAKCRMFKISRSPFQCGHIRSDLDSISFNSLVT